MIELIKTRDFDYLKYLVTKHDADVNEKMLDDVIMNDKNEYYVVEIDGVRSGIVYSRIFGNTCFMDAYSDVVNFFASVVAGKMFCDIMLSRYGCIWTFHKTSRKITTIVCKKIGFVEVNNENGFVLLRKG
jgi:hypothetical protein